MKTQNNNLYILSTPIGNLNDVSINLINTLNDLDYLFCEDTRTSKQLLNKLNINKDIRLISYHKFNETQKLNQVMDLIKQYRCGLISDAGYPSISDPGYIIINQCHKHNIKINVIDGPCSIIHAIVQSGFNQNGFIFLGFLSKDQKQIINQINEYINQPLPLIFLESIHRINNTIDLLKIHYANHLIYVGRELTKLHEEYFIDEIKNIPFITPKGEVIIIIKPINLNQNEVNDNYLLNEINQLTELGLKPKDACKYLSTKLNKSSNNLYKIYLENKK